MNFCEIQFYFIIILYLSFRIKGQFHSTILTQNATLAIILDKSYLIDDYDKIRKEIDDYLIYAKREVLKISGVHTIFSSWTTTNFKQDVTAILSVTSCEKTWNLFEEINNDILYLAITEINCPRLPTDRSIMIPILKLGYELPQLIYDLRQNKAYKWKSAFVLYDDTINKDIISSFITSLTYNGPKMKSDGMSAVLYKLNDNKLNDSQVENYIESVYNSIGINNLLLSFEQNFIITLKFSYALSFMKVSKRIQLVHPNSQWLYIISDTNHTNENINHLLKIVTEGDNVSFLTNATTLKSDCNIGIECHAKELIEAFFVSVDLVESSEMELATQLSEEEFESLKLTKQERSQFMLNEIKKRLHAFGSCNNCTRWTLRAAETWGLTFNENMQRTQNRSSSLLNVGFWRTSDGITQYDELFPHIAHGFRRINLPLISFHNPPWQILETNSSGHVINYDGIIFNLINELSRILNFTFTIHIIKSEFLNESKYTVIRDNIYKVIANEDFLFSACGFTFDPNINDFNFTIPVSIQSYGFLVAKQRELSRVFLFVSPFSSTTWLCLILTIILISPILYMIDNYSPFYDQKFLSIRTTFKTLQQSLWYIFGALLQQSNFLFKITIRICCVCQSI